jgi:hypothetical protein
MHDCAALYTWVSLGPPVLPPYHQHPMLGCAAPYTGAHWAHPAYRTLSRLGKVAHHAYQAHPAHRAALPRLAEALLGAQGLLSTIT